MDKTKSTGNVLVVYSDGRGMIVKNDEFDWESEYVDENFYKLIYSHHKKAEIIVDTGDNKEAIVNLELASVPFNKEVELVKFPVNDVNLK